MSKTFVYDRFDVYSCACDECDSGTQNHAEFDGEWVKAQDAINRDAVLQAEIRTSQAQLKDAKAAVQMQPIETAPDDDLVVVFWLDKSDPENPERHAFDHQEDGVWYQHHEDYEHFCCVAPPGSRGPSEAAPYTHWMPLPGVSA
jgi:hypothetical protein